jgi:hypothetical protein
MARSFALDRTLRVAACFGAILATGCGGGGDGGGSPPPPELLQITAGNQVAVAKATAMNFASLDSVRDVPNATAAAGPKASSDGGSAKHALGKAIAAAGKALPLGTISMTEPCPSGGSIAITLDDRDNNATLSAGDVLTSVFDNCRDSPTSSVNGSFVANIATYSDAAMSGLFSFNQLTVADTDGSASVNGQANLAYTTSRDAAGTWTTRAEMKVVSSLTSALTLPKYKETFTYDADFSGVWNDVTPTAAPGYSTSVLTGKFLAASLGAKAIVATDPPVRDVWTEDAPQSGTVLVTGYQSKLRMTVLNTTTVRLELDANNDGAYESTLDIPWTELLPF